MLRISVGYHRRGDRALCDRATYMHLGRTVAMTLAPSTPRAFDARLRLVNALIPLMVLAISAASSGARYFPLKSSAV
jgi:hypothetical protein